MCTNDGCVCNLGSHGGCEAVQTCGRETPPHERRITVAASMARLILHVKHGGTESLHDSQ